MSLLVALFVYQIGEGFEFNFNFNKLEEGREGKVGGKQFDLLKHFFPIEQGLEF